VSFQEGVLKWWRNAPGFSQQYTWAITDNGNTIIGKGQLLKDGATWEKEMMKSLTIDRLPIIFTI